jgi:hypothetical protein
VCANPLCEQTFESRHAKRRFCSDRCRMEAFQERRRLAGTEVMEKGFVGAGEDAGR